MHRSSSCWANRLWVLLENTTCSTAQCAGADPLSFAGFALAHVGIMAIMAIMAILCPKSEEHSSIEAKVHREVRLVDFIPWKLSHLGLFPSISIGHLPSITEVYFLLSRLFTNWYLIPTKICNQVNHGRPLLHRFHRLFGDHVDHSLRLALVLPLGTAPAEPHRHVR